MPQTSGRPPPGGGDGPGILSCLEGIDNFSIAPQAAPSQAGILRNPRAIFENLVAVSLFVKTAKLLIEARDDAGMAHSVRMGAHHAALNKESS
jgi:hypothetical protein